MSAASQGVSARECGRASMMVEGRGVQQQLLGMHDAVQAWRHQSSVSLVHDHWQALHVHWQ